MGRNEPLPDWLGPEWVTVLPQTPQGRADPDPVSMSPASFELIASLVLRETSIIYEPRKEYLVEARLHPLSVQAGCASIDEYVQLVTRNPVERQKTIDALTINETSWFRDNTPYQAFTETILPALLRARADRRRLSSSSTSTCRPAGAPTSWPPTCRPRCSSGSRTPVTPRSR